MKKQNLGRIAVLAIATSMLTFTYAAGAASIGFVVGSDNLGQSFDNGWIARLGTLGHTVTQFPENTLATDPTLATMSLLIVSSDVGSGGFLGGIGINQPQPIITYEFGLYDEIFGGANNGSTDGVGNNITILNPASPLAAGLSGDVSIYTGGGGGSRINFTPISTGTELIAGSVLIPTNAVMMVLPPDAQGGAGQGGTTSWSAVRIGVPCYANWDPALVTADGWTLLDGAVNYALTPIPEPSSLALLGMGMAFFLARRQRR